MAEPFRSDRQFWVSLAASADAALALVLAAGVAVVVAVLVGGGWPVACFVLPVPWLARAAWAGRTSSRRTRESFSTVPAWRDAERRAVAASFRAALLRPRR